MVFLSTFVRATFGFGDALIAMPLLALIIDIRTATPLVALVGNTIALLIFWKTWRSIHLKSAWKLVSSAVLGVPIGILLLKTAYVARIKFILGVVIIAFSVFELVRPKFHLEGEGKSPFLFGFLGGILGGAYNTGGPPVVIYGTLRRFPPDVFRATLQRLLPAHGTCRSFRSRPLWIVDLGSDPILFFMCPSCAGGCDSWIQN